MSYSLGQVAVEAAEVPWWERLITAGAEAASKIIPAVRGRATTPYGITYPGGWFPGPLPGQVRPPTIPGAPPPSAAQPMNWPLLLGAGAVGLLLMGTMGRRR